MTLKEKVKQCKNICGMHVSLTDVSICDMVGRLGFDFIWIDMEHSYLSCEQLLSHIIALRATKAAVIVRVPQHDLTVTKRVLEMGPDGIIFPMVKSAAEANELISYTLYPPYGKRGFGPRKAVNYGLSDVGAYTKSGHLDMCRFIQIEHKSAVEELGEIIKNEYIDGYIFGPNDLSGSVNDLGNVFGEVNQNLIKDCVSILKKNNKCIGVSTGSIDKSVLDRWHGLGINMISAGADYNFVLEMAQKTLKKLNDVQNNEIITEA